MGTSSMFVEVHEQKKHVYFCDPGVDGRKTVSAAHISLRRLQNWNKKKGGQKYYTQVSFWYSGAGEIKKFKWNL